MLHYFTKGELVKGIGKLKGVESRESNEIVIRGGEVTEKDEQLANALWVPLWLWIRVAGVLGFPQTIETIN